MHGSGFLVVAGSVRPVRRALAIASWVAGIGAETCGQRFEVVDLKDLNLGLDDEPGIPAKGVYLRASTRRWSQLVTSASGVVIVTPQYNWGYPAALKNAIDHLYEEWRDKPVLVVTYGGHGGARCSAQLREVVGGMHARLASARPALKLSQAQIEADDGAVDPDRDFASERSAVEAALQELVALARIRAG
jgi:NAD(P)H-dependent FMN reductase